MVTNTTPDWKSYQATGNIADIVSSPTVASAIGGKVDGENGQAENTQLYTPTISSPAVTGGTLTGTDVSSSEVVTTGAVTSRKLSGKLSEFVSVKDFGALGDGTTDDTSAIQSALNSGISTIFVPPGTYYITSTISIPANVVICGTVAPVISNPPISGVIFYFSSTVGTCVQMGVVNGPVHLSARLENIAIVRSGGASSTIPTGSIGVLVNNTQACVISNVTVYGQDFGFYLKGADPDGITTWLNMCNTGRIQNSHIVIDSLPEVRISNSRFGMNGTGDVNCTNFISFTGGNTGNPAGGPNTVSFVNCQFNQGQNNVTNWLNYNNQTSGSVSDTGYITFDSCYVETITYGVVSDSSWPIVRRLIIGNCNLNKIGVNWFNLNSATTLQDSVISNSIVYGDIILSCTLDKLSISNIVVTGEVSLSCTFSTVAISNLTATGNVTLASQSSSSVLLVPGLMIQGTFTISGAWSNLVCPNSAHGGFSNSATGNVYIGDVAGQVHSNSYTVSSGVNDYVFTYGTTGKLSLQSDGNSVFYNSSSSNPIFGVSSSLNLAQVSTCLSLGKFTVSNLPNATGVPGLTSGCVAYATDGLKPGESSGSGTGVPVFYSADGTWKSSCSGSTVSA